MANILQRLKNNKTLMNGTLFSMFSFINRGISFVLLIILAKYILPGEYGQLSLFNTIVTLLGFFIALSTQGFLSVSYFQRKECFREDVTSIVLVTVACTLAISIILLFSQSALARIADLPPAFLWFALVICFSESLFNMLLDFVRIQEKVVRYGLLSCGVAIINFALSLYLVVYKGLNWEGRVYTHLIIAVVSGVIGLFVFLHKKLFTKAVTWKGTKEVIRWGVPLIPHQATGWIKQGCDRFIINGVHSIYAVGIFSFALNMTSIINMIGTAFNSTNSVTIYQILSSEKTVSEKKKELKKQTKVIGLIYTIGYLLALVAGSLIVWIALPKYSESLPYFWIISVSSYLNCLYYLFVNYLFYYFKNKVIMFVTFGTALLHLCLSLVLTRYSLYWTSIIYVITQAIVLFFIAREALKVIREKLKD